MVNNSERKDANEPRSFAAWGGAKAPPYFVIHPPSARIIWLPSAELLFKSA
jgi:hypothetical protein